MFNKRGLRASRTFPGWRRTTSSARFALYGMDILPINEEDRTRGCTERTKITKMGATMLPGVARIFARRGAMAMMMGV